MLVRVHRDVGLRDTQRSVRAPARCLGLWLVGLWLLVLRRLLWLLASSSARRSRRGHLIAVHGSSTLDEIAWAIGDRLRRVPTCTVWVLVASFGRGCFLARYSMSTTGGSGRADVWSWATLGPAPSRGPTAGMDSYPA